METEHVRTYLALHCRTDDPRPGHRMISWTFAPPWSALYLCATPEIAPPPSSRF